MAVRRGRLIVFEGPDGSGKTSCAEILAKTLHSLKLPVISASFPGKEPRSLGSHIYNIHHNIEDYFLTSPAPEAIQALHIAAHIDQIKQQLVPAIESGSWVILDRFWWSTLVYARLTNCNEVVIDKLISAELEMWGKIRPDWIFVFERNNAIKKNAGLAMLYKQISNEFPKSRRCKINNDGDIRETVKSIIGTLIDNGVIPNRYRDIVQLTLTNVSVPIPAPKQLDLFKPKQTPTTVRTVRRIASTANLLHPAKPTEVYDLYWSFATERQNIFFRRYAGEDPPWTDDKILLTHKFTNAYRASDRVSQYLIHDVIGNGKQEPVDTIFRILLFKVFNNIETWEFLQSEMGTIAWQSYSYRTYNRLLSNRIKSNPIFSAAYIMPSGGRNAKYPKKHQRFLKLIERAMHDDLLGYLQSTTKMIQGFERLRAMPMIGDFLAYQYITDINYSYITDYTEHEFVVAGPGAKSGIAKCFLDTGGLSEEEIIKRMFDVQHEEFSQRGLDFRNLWGRDLQLIDLQNIFCEIDKYTRISHPHIKGIGKRNRIKQKYNHEKSVMKRLPYLYPPKWGINQNIG